MKRNAVSELEKRLCSRMEFGTAGNGSDYIIPRTLNSEFPD